MSKSKTPLVDKLILKASRDMSMKVWPGMKDEPTFQTFAVIYAIRESDEPLHTPEELATRLATRHGGSFRMYENLDPVEGYVEAVRKAQDNGYIRMTRTGYSLTPSGRRASQQIKRAQQMLSIA